MGFFLLLSVAFGFLLLIENRIQLTFSSGELKTYYIVVPKLFMQYIWTILNKNTQTFERSRFEIDERENIKVFSLTQYHFSLRKLSVAMLDFHRLFIFSHVILKSDKL